MAEGSGPDSISFEDGLVSVATVNGGMASVASDTRGPRFSTVPTPGAHVVRSAALSRPSAGRDDDDPAIEQAAKVAEGEQSRQAGDVENAFHVRCPVDHREEKTAHVVEREALQLLGGDRRDQDG